MLSDDHAVEDTVFGNAGIGSGLPAGAIHISCSTISTNLARRLALEHNERGQSYLSAPVFGRPEAAEAKKLLVVAAGPKDLIDRCQEVFDSIGRQTFVAGQEPWQANAVKLCGNFMIASMDRKLRRSQCYVTESRRRPASFSRGYEALFASAVYANYGRIIADEQFEPAGFALRLGLKDVRLMLETAQECQAPMPLASLIRDHLLSAMAAGQPTMTGLVSRESQLEMRDSERCTISLGFVLRLRRAIRVAVVPRVCSIGKV